MKKNRNIKGALLQATLVASILLFSSCENEKGSIMIAEERNDRKFEENEQEQKDAQFLVIAAEINLKEIQLGRLAQQNGQILQVKELGKMMEDAHVKSQQDLMVLAESKRITIPTKPTEDSNKTYAKLHGNSGNNFDKAYTDKMVSAHENAIQVFQQALKDSNDIDIKIWAKATLVDLRKHLHQSIEYKQKYEASN